MRFRHVVVPGVLVPSMALVSTAEAELPAPKVTTIVPGKSVAGVRLGMNLSVAKKTWGAGSECAAAPFRIPRWRAAAGSRRAGLHRVHVVGHA